MASSIYPMRIGLVTGEFPPMEGGVGAFTRELARALAVQGHEIHVITHRDARPKLPDGERYSLGQLREPLEASFGWLHPRAGRWGWGDVGQIADIAIRYDLDILNIQYQAAAYNMRSPAINVAPWRLRSLATTVVTYHDLRVPYLFPKAGRLRRFFVSWMARLAHGAIVTNAQDYESLRAAKVDARRLCQIPIGSNISVHEVDADVRYVVRRQLQVRPADFLLGYFGFLNESKGADSLLRALSRLDDRVHLVFIGGKTGSSDTANNAAFVQHLEELIEDLDLSDRVHWTGYLPDESVSEHMKAADLMVLPYRDGVSLRRGTLMAALAHGRPIVSTEPEKPVGELQHGHNIWLAPRADHEALALAIARLREEPERRAELGKAAARSAQQFSWETIAADTAAFFARLQRHRS